MQVGVKYYPLGDKTHRYVLEVLPKGNRINDLLIFQGGRLVFKGADPKPSHAHSEPVPLDGVVRKEIVEERHAGRRVRRKVPLRIQARRVAELLVHLVFGQPAMRAIWIEEGDDVLP
jgi:hypothetical protein